MKFNLAVALLALMLVGAGASGDELAENQERLEAIRQRIDQVKDDLEADREQEDKVTRELRRLEERIGQLSAEVSALDDSVDAKSERVSELRREYDAASERLESQRRFLRRQIRAAYGQGRESYLQLLLNQEDPDAVDRTLVYYDYFNEARSRRIREAISELAELRQLRQSLDQRLAELESLRRERRDRLTALRDQRSERDALLEKLRQRIGQRDARLAQLRTDAERLSDLVERLRGRLSDIPDDPIEGKAFGARKGQLGWPLAGELLGDYGSQRAGGGASWDGLLIDAEVGDRVRAVAHGRVVFADWLRGLGLLIIIDHGDGYMTLYGHNQSLHSETGEWVAPGDVVATAGASGGRDRAALYFELRSQGQPVDPTAWLGPQSPAG